ncbi:hypothetical protein KUTeg_005246, partial [Tegillarca granosa]
MAMFQPEVEKSITDISKFQSIVKLAAFSPFKSGTNALDNINSISEGLLHDDLKLFVETNVPKPAKKKEKVTLGVADAKIGAAISEELGVNCLHTGVVPEVIRGLTDKTASKAQLGLGHSYSRAKVKFNVNRADNMIIQKWYSYHFPELVKIVNDNYMFAKVAHYIGNRKELTEDKLEELEEIVMDSAKARAIYDASRSSMGMDISPIDLMNIEIFATKVISLSDYRKSLATYLRNKMGNIAPNLACLIGEQVAARLIAHAGSLTNLAKYPASTVQILGAEKALFRALKTRGNTPKYGLIFHSTFIGRAGTKNKGRISRYLANKCSIASRIDCFAEYPTTVFGEHLKQQVEDRLKFYETGEAPQKNVDVMKQAVEEAVVVQEKLAKKEKKRKKKEKRKSEAMNESSQAETTMEDVTMETEDEPPKKKKKKKKSKEEDEENVPVAMEEESPAKKAKKKKKKKQKNDDD